MDQQVTFNIGDVFAIEVRKPDSKQVFFTPGVVIGRDYEHTTREQWCLWQWFDFTCPYTKILPADVLKKIRVERIIGQCWEACAKKAMSRKLIGRCEKVCNKDWPIVPGRICTHEDEFNNGVKRNGAIYVCQRKPLKEVRNLSQQQSSLSLSFEQYERSFAYIDEYLCVDGSVEFWAESTLFDTSSRQRIPNTLETRKLWAHLNARAEALGGFELTRPQPKPKPPKPHPRSDEVKDMWSLFVISDEEAKGKRGKFTSTTSKLFAGLPRKLKLEVYRQYRDLCKQLNTWELWRAAYVMNGGCSDDGFSAFRLLLIVQGKKVIDAAMKDADSLASVTFKYATKDEFEFEALSECFAINEGDPSPSMTKPKGKRFSESSDDLKLHLPKLWAKYS